jgi:WXG100 family type VII secretion target
MSDVRAEPEAMDAIAAQVSDEVTAISGTLDGFAAGVNVLAAGWSGQAHDAFDAAYTGWHRDMTAQHDLLDAAAHALRTAADAYDRADRAVARIWSL